MNKKSDKLDFTVLLYSSDYYKDCWQPFFDLWKKYFKTELRYEVILITNTLSYAYDGLAVRALPCGLDTPWSKRLRLGLEAANTEMIFLIGDDFFPLSEVHTKLIEEQFALIQAEKKIDHVRLLYKPGKFKTQESTYPNLDRIESYTKYRFLFAPSFWKKSALTKYLVDFESPFMAEKMGTYKSWILNHGMYCVSKAYVEQFGRPFDCGSSGVIVKGKWAAWSVPILEKEKLGIDFGLRGIRKEEEKKAAMNKARMSQLKEPVQTLRSYLAVFKLIFTR